MGKTITRRDFLKGTAAGTLGIAMASLLPGAEASLGKVKAAEATYIPGTYTGTADGISSTVTVTMTFDEESITDVVVDTSGETASIGAAAADELQEALLAAQSAEIDGVSGATVTSDAVKKAAAQCIAQAKGEEIAEESSVVSEGDDEDWLGAEPEVDESLITETIDTDILIVGAGNGGLMAAAYAADKGLDFHIIEQNGNVQDTRHWCGAVNGFGAQEAGITTDTHKLLGEISRYASGKCDQRVVKTWINESADMVEYVRSIMTDVYGIDMVYTYGDEARWPEDENSTDYMFPEIEYTYDRSGGESRNTLLEDYIGNKGYSIDFYTSLVKLEKNEEGRVTGIIAQSTEDSHYIRYNAAQGVLLATGGYPGNPYMMQQLDPLGTSVTTACSYSPSDKGMGIRAAVWAGASLDKEAAPMLFDRGIVAPGVDAGYSDSPSSYGGKEFAGPIRQYNPGTQPFLKVNRNGERFANESCPYNDIVYAAANQPGHVYCQIHDANYYEDCVRFHTIGCSAQSRSSEEYYDSQIETAMEAGVMFKADTLEELADQLGFEGDAKDTLLATIERYNELYDQQDDEDFGKMPTRLSEIRTAPFYGCWLGASLLTTEQGIAINEKTQALDADRNPIEGLYVTGDCSGSFFANNYPCLMPGIALGRTLTFALKAIRVMSGEE
ncbi:MAG: FAD-binding protein [Lachnospiraceae bacterium]|nr:FAD-binding protein [Lachnospiraceae bacterium]